MQRLTPAGRAPLWIRAAGFVLLLVHLTAIWWFTLRPASVPWVDGTNLEPLQTIRAKVSEGGWAAVRGIGGPFALLAPAGVVLPMLGGRLHVAPVGSFVRTVFAGSMLGLVVELLRTGVPGQVGNVDAVLLGTAGVAVLHLAVVPTVRAVLRRRESGAPNPVRTESQGETPRFSGVGVAP
ncbi:VanZ family protein [Streptomyces smaragdinus]|uniref:VanZ family protein n=1 Tax=Streptomyces smaragdinus TaxID=2585196 RepID=UPI002B1F2C85|nr:VanZ family protein [Streptomyces smaragdinus]